jgi:hypothetical protein
MFDDVYGIATLHYNVQLDDGQTVHSPTDAHLLKL